MSDINNNDDDDDIFTKDDDIFTKDTMIGKSGSIKTYNGPLWPDYNYIWTSILVIGRQQLRIQN